MDPIKGERGTETGKDGEGDGVDGDVFQIQLGINNSSVLQHSAVTKLYNNVLYSLK
jgi:hypothetical protein